MNYGISRLINNEGLAENREKKLREQRTREPEDREQENREQRTRELSPW